MTMGKVGFRLLTSGVGISAGVHPDTADGKFGRVQAIDVANQKLAWVYHQVTPPSTGLLATGGGLVFSGDTEPSLKAFDDSSGELLWQAALDDSPSSGLITYQVDEKQYVAVVVGMRNFHIDALSGALGALAPGGRTSTALKGGAAIWVFGL
jgi:glucose dehydrogenase